MSPRVAVLGLGAMGLPMATHLARDHEVIAFDVNPERLSLAELAGARPAESPAQACAGADVSTAPSGPNSALSSWAASRTPIRTTSAPAHAWAGDSAGRAPASSARLRRSGLTCLLYTSDAADEEDR